MSTDTTRVTGGRAALAGDACLFTATAFSVLSAIAGAIVLLGGASPIGGAPPPGVSGIVLQVVASVLIPVSLALGPIAAWHLHGRRFGGVAVLGFLLGIVAGVATVQVIALLAMLAGTTVERVTGVELAGLIAMLAIVAAAFLAVVVALDIDAVRDLSPERGEHRRLDIARIVATVVVLVYMAGTIGLNVANPKSEIGEAGIFALGAGIFGAVVVAVADAVRAFVERRSST